MYVFLVYIPIMADLFTPAQKAQLSSKIDDIHDTFKRPIVVYKDPQMLVISSNPNYNRFQANDQNITTNPVNVPQRHVINVRILYKNEQEIPFIKLFAGGLYDEAAAKLRESAGEVRIKVHKDDNEIFKDAKLCEFDGNKFTIDSDKRPHGLFDIQYYTYYLKRDI